MSLWRPIETAPRDGTGILLLSPEGDVGMGYLLAEMFDDMLLMSGPAAWFGQRPYERKPSVWLGRHGAEEATHWMPLPAPPETARTKPDFKMDLKTAFEPSEKPL